MLPHSSWFPVALLLVVALTTLLGINGPILTPGKLGSWLQGWQTLIAASIAIIAAIIAWQNTSRANAQAAELERHRRAQKHASLRAVMPLALAEITEYAVACADLLRDWHAACKGNLLPTLTLPKPFVPKIPTDGIAALAEFIEYADTLNAEVLEAAIARIQILAARLRSVAVIIDRRSRSVTVTKTNVENYLIDAAIVHAGIASAYNFSRRRSSGLPSELLWDNVRKALNNLDIDDSSYPDIHMKIKQAEALKPHVTI